VHDRILDKKHGPHLILGDLTSEEYVARKQEVSSARLQPEDRSAVRIALRIPNLIVFVAVTSSSVAENLEADTLFRPQTLANLASGSCVEGRRTISRDTKK
jgi:hypothetical protein